VSFYLVPFLFSESLDLGPGLCSLHWEWRLFCYGVGNEWLSPQTPQKKNPADDWETGDPGGESIQREELAKDGKDDCGGLGRGIRAEVFGKGRF
jgi:hypothetical protein